MRRVPLTPPKVEQATKSDITQATGPKSLGIGQLMRGEGKLGTCWRRSWPQPQSQAPGKVQVSLVLENSGSTSEVERVVWKDTMVRT